MTRQPAKQNAADPTATLLAWGLMRTQYETVEYHLRKVVEAGDRLSGYLREFDDVARGNSPELIANARLMIDSPGISEVLATAERAKKALAELSKWKDRTLAEI
ncbi:hypothetical protein [Streptomyces sp. NPDC059071]|uniref:hypothetical protein n=1 Tax=unclassified Streptomyces TaxID=2593676 RepID=UPI003664875E